MPEPMTDAEMSKPMSEVETAKTAHLLRLVDENTRLKEFIKSSEECAAAVELVQLYDRYEKLRLASSQMLEKWRAGAIIHTGNCQWCGESWPHPDGATFEEIKAEAMEHDNKCTKHPIRIERDELRIAVMQVATVQLRRRRDAEETWMIRQAANDLSEPFSMARAEKLLAERLAEHDDERDELKQQLVDISNRIGVLTLKPEGTVTWAELCDLHTRSRPR